MTDYSCYETNVITETPYSGVESGFCIVENYDAAYQKELPRFRKSDFRAYGLPYGDVPEKRYLGIGKLYSEESADHVWNYDDTPLQSENEAAEINDTYYTKEHRDVVWFRIHGSMTPVPEGYHFYGYDVTYTPEPDGAYSIINDCMFICKWHGCDEDGTAFRDYFKQLNDHGLFNKADTAMSYMKHYLSFDWSERGNYCICEVFRKNK